MANIKKFEVAVVGFATLMIGGGIWGVFFDGLSSAGLTHTSAVAGVVSEIKTIGEVKRHFAHNLDWKSLPTKSDVFEGDTVYVGPNSSLNVKMTDNTIVTVGEDSLVVFERAKLLSGGQTSVYLVKGQVAIEGDNVAVSVADGKKLVANHRAKFTVSKREKKVSVSVDQSEAKGVVYLEKEQVRQEMSAEPKLNIPLVTVAEAEAISAEEPAAGTLAAADAKPEQIAEADIAASVKEVNATDPASALKAAESADPYAYLNDTNATPLITLLSPNSGDTIDLTREFQAMTFKFHASDGVRDLKFQVSSKEDFSSIAFQSRIVKSEIGKGSNNGQDYGFKLSGLYLALTEPIMSLAYGVDHKIYWRVISVNPTGQITSAPRLLSFAVNASVKVTSKVGASEKARKPANVGSSEVIMWNVENRIPTRYRINFYADKNFENKICAETIHTSGMSMNVTAGQSKIETAKLSSSEEFEPARDTFCHGKVVNAKALAAAKKSVYYRIEPISPNGIALAIEKGSTVRGVYSIR